MRLYIVQNGTSTPLLAWILEEGESPTSPCKKVTNRNYNALVKANNIFSLLKAVQNLGILYPPESLFLSRESNSLGLTTVHNLLKRWEQEGSEGLLSEITSASLYTDICLYPFSKQEKKRRSCVSDAQAYGNAVENEVPFRNKQAVKHALEEYGLSKQLLLKQKSDTRIYLESLQDWLFVRNALVLCSQIYVESKISEEINRSSTLEPCNKEVPSSLSDIRSVTLASFGRTQSSRFREFKSFIEQSAPLVSSVTDQLSDDCDRQDHVFRMCSSAILSFRCYDIEGSKNADDFNSGVRFRTEISIEAQEDFFDRSSLKDIFYAFHEYVFRGFNGSWEDVLGGTIPEGPTEGNGGSCLGVASLVAALWHKMIHHQGCILICCARCGNAVLSSARGSASRYCSATCRNASSKERRHSQGLSKG